MPNEGLFQHAKWNPIVRLAACALAMSLAGACGDGDGQQAGNLSGQAPTMPTAPAMPTAGAGMGGPQGDPSMSGTAGNAMAGQGDPTTGQGDGNMGDGSPSDASDPAADASATPMTTDAGAPGALADAGAGDAAVAPPMREDLGEGDGSDVITIGDSWMDYFLSGGGIEGALARAGKSYRNYGVSGTQFLNGVIPRQYDTAKSRDPDIMTVIMTGGGNDILLGGYNCDTAAACERYVNDLVAGLNELWTEMSNDGVQDVIYINYSSDAGDTPTDTRPMERPRPEICLTGPIRCHSLQTTDLVMGDLVDGIHPSRAANDRIAAAVMELMEQEGMRR